MKKIIFVFGTLLTFITMQSFAQADSTTSSVVVYKDPRIDVLGRRQLEINNNIARAASRSAMGFRIQVLSTSDRELVMQTRTQLLQKFPDQKNYMIFQAPYVKLRFGNFKTKQEAESYKKQISKLLNGASVYIIPERIEVNPDATENNVR